MTEPERAPRLVLRFAFFTALGLAAAAAAILIVVRQADTVQAEQQAIGRARLVTRAALDRELRAADLAAPVSAARRRQLDRLFRTRILLEGIGRATLYAPDGRVTYSTSAAARRAQERDSRLRTALGGALVSDIRKGASGRVLRTYVPLTLGSQKVDGAVLLEQDYEQIEAAATRTSWVIAGVLEALLVLLCLVFLPTLARLTSRVRRHIADLERVATHDDLTGLLNRTGFRRAAAASLRARETTGAVLLVDLEGFSALNDLLGAETADTLLSEVASRLKSDFEDAGALARLGEDEFGLFLRNADRVDIAIAAEGVQRALEPAFVLDGVRVAVGVSMGAALFPEHGDDFATLLRRAGTALTVAREEGRGGVEIYDPSHEASDVSRLALAVEFREALARGELRVHYQPLVDTTTRTVRGAEALLRWEHAEQGLLPAAAFIAQAERSGLAKDIRHFVFETAARQWRDWKSLGLDLELAVNVGTVDMLDASLPDEIEALLERHGVPAWNLVLEITERTLIADERHTARVVDRLKRLGVRLAIDDFGIGYSSLASLRRLPVEQVKLDGSLLAGAPGEPAAEAVMRGSVELAHALGATVVAEGVETGAQWDFVVGIGCDIAQGYLIGRAVPGDELCALVQAEPSITSEIAA